MRNFQLFKTSSLDPFPALRSWDDATDFVKQTMFFDEVSPCKTMQRDLMVVNAWCLLARIGMRALESNEERGSFLLVVGHARGRKRVIKRLFSLGVLEATPERKAPTLWVRPER